MGETIKHVTLAPGGLVVYAYAGFFIQNKHILKDVETVTGASAGALWGMLYAFGYSPERILEMLLSVNLKEVMKPSAVAFVRQYGVYSLDPLRSTLLEMVEGRDLTFGELDKTLYVGAYCLSLSRTMYFSRETTPGVKVIDAVLASAGVPGLVPPVKINGMYFVDGGFADVWPADPVIHCNPKEVLKVAPSRRNWNPKMEDVNSLGEYFKLIVRSVCCHRFDCTMAVQCVDFDIPSDIDMFDFASDYDTLLKIAILGQGTGYFLGE